jgi:hypothetical protein
VKGTAGATRQDRTGDLLITRMKFQIYRVRTGFARTPFFRQQSAAAQAVEFV